MMPVGTEAARGLLAPTGKLRVGAFFGSPLSMVMDRSTGEMHGLSIDLGKALASRLDVVFELASYQRIAEVLAAMKAGNVDFTVSKKKTASLTIDFAS